MEVPTETAVTKPVELTVATEVFEEVHGFVTAGTPDPVSCDVVPTHLVNNPLIVGGAITVIIT